MASVLTQSASWNGVPFEQMGLVQRPDGLVDAWGKVERARERQPVPNAAGDLIGSVVTQAGRLVRWSGYLVAASFEAREAARRTLAHQLAGEGTLSLPDAPELCIDAECVKISETAPFGQSVYRNVPVAIDLEFRATHAVKRERSPRALAFSATPTPIPLGTAPSGGRVYLMGAATNPVLSCVSATGLTVWSLTFTVTLDSNDYLELDLDALTVVHSNNGVRSNGMPLQTAGTWGVLDPEDSDGDSAWPTLQVSAGTGLWLGERRFDW